MQAQIKQLKNLAQGDLFGSGVRVVMNGGEPWFVAKDVCEILGIEWYRNAIMTLDNDEKRPVIVDTLGGKQEMAAVSESGLYTLILRSRKPEAKAFKRWILRRLSGSVHGLGSTAKAVCGVTESELRGLADAASKASGAVGP